MLCTASVRLRLSRDHDLVSVLGRPEAPRPVPEDGHDPTPAEQRTGRRVGQMVTRVAALLPWHPTCLPQALATRWMLRRRQVPSALHLGLADARSLDAHAWVTVGPRTVVGRVAQPFTGVASFPG